MATSVNLKKNGPQIVLVSQEEQVIRFDETDPSQNKSSDDLKSSEVRTRFGVTDSSHDKNEEASTEFSSASEENESKKLLTVNPDNNNQDSDHLEETNF